MDNQELVTRIRNLCQSVGITVKGLEVTLGFSNGTISKWAGAKKPPPFERLSQVAEFFGCSVPFLRGEGSEPYDGSGFSGNARVCATLFDSAPAWVKEQVLSLLRAAIQNEVDR